MGCSQVEYTGHSDLKGSVQSYKDIQSTTMKLFIRDVYSCEENFNTYFGWCDSAPTLHTIQEELLNDSSVHINLSTDSAIGRPVRPA